MMNEAGVKSYDFLSGGGKMGELIRNFDWGKTPLDTPEHWSQSLQSTVSIMLANRFPMLLWWGPQYISLYNDAYAPILGTKHPNALSLPVEECWSEIWHILKPLIDTPFQGGASTWIEDFQLLINRKGTFEESHFTVAYSPVPDKTVPTGIGGVLASVHEITEKIISERALATLRELGEITFVEKSLDAVYHNVADVLGKNNKDFPFALIYKITGDENTVTVAASTGINQTQHVFPPSINIAQPNDTTKEFCQAFRENKTVVSEIKTAADQLPKGAWETAPTQFVHLPVSAAGANHPYCIISAALNPYRKFDEAYHQFCQLISDRVSLEINKMLALEEEIKRAEALAEIDRAKTVFFSNISHEFRTPLTLMLGPLEELLQQPGKDLDSGSLSAVETTHRNALRLLRLVNTLLDFSRIESGRQEANFTKVDIASYTKKLAISFHTLMAKAGLKFEILIDTIEEPVYVDPQMWEKIVFNLLSNAFKYTLYGSIKLGLTTQGKRVILKVEDTGAGIPESELPKMFERFHRVEGIKGRTYEGTGIGLSFVKELVALHGGTITVDSKEGLGSTFTVNIPLGKEHLPLGYIALEESDFTETFSKAYIEEATTLLENASAIHEPEGTPKNGTGLKDTVLIVDDSADMRQYLTTILEKNYHVVTAINGMDALHKIQKKQPSLVLTDLMMPVMDGNQLVNELKSNPVTSHLPMIVLSARAGEESRIEGYNIGADDYLVKPFSAKELVSRVANQIKTQKIRTRTQTQLRNIFKAAPVAIAVTEGATHRFVFVNPGGEKLSNRTEEQLLGKTIQELFPELESQGIIWIFDQVFKTREPFVMNGMPLAFDKLKDGILRQQYFNISIEPIKQEESAPLSLLTLIVDVTEQVEARKKIEESGLKNAILGAIVESSEDAIVSKTLQGIVTSWNPGAQKLFGFTPDEMIGQSITKLIPEDRLDEEPQIIRKIQSGQTVDHFETKRKTKSGQLINISLTISPIRNEDGKIVGASKIARDISERKRTETHLAFLAEISRDLVQITDWQEMMPVIGEKIGTFFNVAVCSFAQVDENHDQLTVIQDWHRTDAPSLVGTYRLADYATDEVLTLLKENGIYVVRDVGEDKQLDKENNEKFGLASAVLIPYLKEGKLGYLLSIHDAVPRNWRNDEVELMQELTTRIWTRLEKAKVEESLKKSEEKYRTLFNSIDEGFCIIEVLFDEHEKPYDYRFLEANAAFVKHTGLVDAIGKTIKEINPGHEQHWFDTYGRIVKTGKPEHFEDAADALGYYYEVYAFAPNAPEEHHVAVLFKDITERKRRENAAVLLATIGKELEQFSSLEETLEVVGAKIAQHFKVASCSFTEVNEEKDEASILYNWKIEGFPGLPTNQPYRLHDFISEEFYTAIRSGKLIAVNDTATHKGTDQQAFDELKVRSFLTSAFIQNDKWLFSLVISDTKPRNWRTDEIELMQELADRIWTRLEKAKAEQTLKQNEQRLLQAMHAGHQFGCEIDFKTQQITYSGDQLAVLGFQPPLAPAERFTLIHPDDVEPLRQAMFKAIELHEPINVTYRFLVPESDGKVVWVHMEARHFGIPHKYVGNIRNITAIKEAESIQTYLLKLSDTLRSLADPIEIQEKAMQVLGQHLGVLRAQYWETEDNDQYLVSSGGYSSDGIPIVGRVRMEDFGPYVKEAFQSGQTLAVVNTKTDSRVSEAEHAAYAYLGIQAFLSVTLVKEGRFVVGIGLHHATPHYWTEGEIAVTEETAQRTWAAIERAKTEKALQQSREAIDQDLRSTQWLHNLSERLVSASNLQLFYEEIVNAAIALTGGDAGTVQKLDEETGELVMLVSRGFDQKMLDHFHRVDARSNTSCGIALLNNERTFVDFDKPEEEDPDASMKMHRDAGYLSAQSTPLVTRSGKPIGMVSTHWHKHHRPSERELRFLDLLARQAADLLERKQQEERYLLQLESEVQQRTFEISKQKDFIETIINSTPDLVTAYDIEFRFIAFNKACEDFFHIKREDVIGKGFTEVFPTAKGGQGENDLMRVFQGEIIHNAVYHSPVTGKYYENYISPLKDEIGEIYAALAIAHDITDNINATAYLKQSEEKFNKLFAASPLGLVLSEASSGKITDANETYCETIGYPKEECISSTSFDLNVVDQDFREQLLDQLEEQGFVRNAEMEITRKNGEKIPVLNSIEKITIGDKEYFLSAIIDITDRKNAERKIEEKNKELQKINKELEAFTYISSHDLQEPLRKIQTFAGRILDKEESHFSEGTKAYFSRITDAATRMQALIQDLLSFSRLTNIERIFELTDLHEIVADVKTQLSEVIEAKGATIEASDLHQVNIIPFQFRQLLYNLVSNALKFAQPGIPSHIVIKSEIVSGTQSPLGGKKACHITVADNGIGFEKNFSEKIFEVFQKLHSKDQYEGTGIGLAIVKKIVEHHDGLVTASSELNKGATFDIYIPA